MGVMPSAAWNVPSQERGVDAVLARWLASSWVKPCFCADETIPGADGVYADVPSDMAPSLVRALRAQGVERLYGHQARAFEFARAKRHLAISTPTASGKSYC